MSFLQRLRATLGGAPQPGSPAAAAAAAQAAAARAAIAEAAEDLVDVRFRCVATTSKVPEMPVCRCV